ncbi:NnrS family protein [Marinobacterium weihaiense]|uniref:NnrS family protein n=1 Tax=Marinobacterium weihaiense TaxID=2851016 RepID=A0ABS6MAG6_9GAMM|nr:NnrS family protein [Marinobacterium weihaiense]MBV0932747.1 NnrS family protein [Marinobacterium weihaiense]
MVNLEAQPDSCLGWIFSNGFRPLFVLATTQALLMLATWLLFWSGWLAPPATLVSTVVWHGHEMLFGFVGAAIGGFLLAAVANWTGRKPVAGAPLMLLAASWLLARAVAFLGGDWPDGVNALGAVSYWLLLAFLFGRELIKAGNRRNLKVLVILAGFALLILAYHLHWLPALEVLHLTLVLVLMLLTLIGGRITPAFTRNWLNRQEVRSTRMPAPFGLVDVAAAALTPVAGIIWVFWPAAMLTAVLLLLAGVAQLLRLWRWHGWQTRSEPLLLVLHIGYAWLGIGLLLLAGSSAGLWAMSAGLHALTVGAMGGMIMAVASRAALGHTGRELTAGPILTLAFVTLHLAALVRVLAALFPQGMMALIMVSGLLWLLAFALFAWRYLPILLGPSVPFSERLKAQRKG